MFGKRTMEVEIPQPAPEEVNMTESVRCFQEMTDLPLAAICRTLEIRRSTADRPTRERPSGYGREEDA